MRGKPNSVRIRTCSKYSPEKANNINKQTMRQQTDSF